MRLLAVGADPHAVVAAIASSTGWAPRIAEGIVDHAPVPVRSGIPRADADAIAAALEAAGAKVAVIEIPQ